MEIASIKGDTVLLLYHPAEATADVGQQLSLLEVPDRSEGLVIQVISNDSLEYAGIQQEMIQRILEQRVAMQRLLDREEGMGEIKSLKLATAKIRKRIHTGRWSTWDGWIPTRHVDISRVDAATLLQNVMPRPEPPRLYLPIQSFVTFDGVPIQFNGPLLNMVNVVTGVKGSGKSHLSKHLVLALTARNVPCVIFDINGEYLVLPNAQVLRWGQNFLPNLADVGYEMLRMMVSTIYPLQPGTPSEAVFESRLPMIFNARRQYCQSRGEPFTIDIPFLRQQTWGGGDHVVRAIDARLDLIERMNLFWSHNLRDINQTQLADLYNNACQGQPIIFDMRDLSSTLQQALVNSINQSIKTICKNETTSGATRYPFVFFEEAHFYISEATIVDIITRGRHIGMASVFVTNTPEKLPVMVFRQLDNLFLLSLTHKDDIRNVSKNSFTDEDTIESFATRMPEHHALIIGNVTDRYPLVVRVDRLPDNVPTTGRTRSTWDRFASQQE